MEFVAQIKKAGGIFIKLTTSSQSSLECSLSCAQATHFANQQGSCAPQGSILHTYVQATSSYQGQ